MIDIFKKSIGVKLTFWLSAALVFVFLCLTAMNVTTQERILKDKEVEVAEQLCETVLTAIRYPMKQGEQDIVQIQFEQFQTSKMIEEVQLLDEKLVVKRSMDTEQIGKELELRVDQQKHLSAAVTGLPFSDLEVNKKGQKVFTILKPIKNDDEEKCYVCHGRNAKLPWLGVLRIVFDWSSVEKTMSETKMHNIFVSIIGMVLMAVLIFLLLRRMLNKPVGLLIAGSVPLSNGDLTQKIDIKTQDELGRLADAFNKIISAMHQIVSQVRSSADKVASSAQEMSSSSEEMNATTQEVSNAILKVSKGTNTQAERIEETFVTMEHTSSSIKQMVSNAQTANKAVSHTSEIAQSGKEAANAAVLKIEKLTGTVTDTAKVIQNLGQMSQQIGEITETITSIADQTNLLALNAAIEAARAGEAGRGFAVVAEEVRKLAEGSAEAVRKIGGLIKSIQNETNHAVNSIEVSTKEVQDGKEQVSKISGVLSEINQAARDASGVTAEISEFGQKLIVEVERVVKAINEVAAISKESASTVEEVSSSTEEQTASMEEMSASAQELARLAMDLKEIVGRFKLEETIQARKK